MSMTLIEHIELTGSVSSLVLDNIPQTYNDLYVLLSTRSTRNAGAATFLYLQANSITTSSYTTNYLGGAGTSLDVGSTTSTKLFMGFTSSTNNTANTFGNTSVYIPNYTSSANKSVSIDATQENNTTNTYKYITAGLLSITNPLTSLTFILDDGSTPFDFVAGSSATIYGITAGSDGTTTVS